MALLAVDVVEIVGPPSPPDPQPESERKRIPKAIEQVWPMMDFRKSSIMLVELFIIRKGIANVMPVSMNLKCPVKCEDTYAIRYLREVEVKEITGTY